MASDRTAQFSVAFRTMSVGVRNDTVQIVIVSGRVDMLEDKFAEPLIAIY
ncbi:hypothetical protein [Candidatus Binatus sp.]|jgi:hypothetical protein